MKKILFINLLLLLLFPYFLSADNNQINGSCDGEIVEELHNVSTNVTREERGAIRNGQDHYYFTVASDGVITISSTGNMAYDFSISNSSCGNWNLYNNTSSNHATQTIQVSSGDTIYFRLYDSQRAGRVDYRVNITFTAGESIYYSDDSICYSDIQKEGAMCMQFGDFYGGFGCKTTTTIKNNQTQTLSNVKVTKAYSGFTGLLNSECGVDGVTGANCLINNAFSMFGYPDFLKGIDYTLNTLNSNDTHTIYDKSLISMSISDIKLFADYYKDSKHYKVEIEKCQVNYQCPNPRDFTIAYQTNVKGDIELIGNTVMCMNDGGACGDPGDTRNNNINMMFIDGDSDGSTFNSSAARLNLPVGSEILWVGLYWQGYLSGGSDTQKESSSYIKYAYSSTKTGSLNYITKKADNHNWVYYNDTRWYYQGSVEITDLVKTNKNGWYWVADIVTQTGQPVGGSYGAWSIAIVYKNSSKHLKNLTVYDGYVGIVTGGDNTAAHTYATTNNCPSAGVDNTMSIELSGFITPSRGAVDSKFFVFAGEGDKTAAGDYLKMTNKSGTNKELFGAVNPNNDIFNSTISKNGSHLGSLDLYPHYSTNSNGIDIDTFDLNSIYPEYIIENDQTSTTVTLNTVGDGYHPGVFGFSTDLYEPRVCYVQNLLAENNGTIYPNDPIIVDITIKNTKKDENDTNLEPAAGVMVTTKIDNEYLEYKPNSLWINDIEDITYVNMSDIVGDDRGEFYLDENKSKYRVGRGANSTNGGRLEPLDELKVKFTAIIKKSGDFNISNEYLITYTNEQIGKVFNDIPIEECVDFNTSLQVDQYGKFRVIEGKYKTLDWNSAWNKKKLETKIAPLGENEFCIFAADGEGDDANPITEDINVDVQLLDFSTNPSGVIIQNLGDNYIVQNLTIPQGDKACFTLPTNLYNKAAKLLAFKVYQSESVTNEAKSDYFTLRPDRFFIETNTTNLFAGERFSLIFKALDSNNNPLNNYNEKAIDSNSSFMRELNVTIGCTMGNLSLESPIIFSNGIANVNATYSEVGDLNITIKEKIGNEFAVNDKNDTLNIADRLITSFTLSINHNPFRLEVRDLDYQGGFATTPNWWLYSGAFPTNRITVTSTIRALSQDGNITQNFEGDCAATPVDISYDINSTNNSANMNYRVSFIGDFNDTIAEINATQTIPANTFNQGEANIVYSYNVDKNISNPINPFTLNANSLNIVSTNVSKFVTNANINGVTNIYYARVATKTLKTKVASENAPLEVEVFSSNNSPLVNGFQQTYLNWYKNDLHDINANGTIINQKNENSSGSNDSSVTFTNNGVDGNGTLNFVITNTTPNVSKSLIIHLDISPWLWHSTVERAYDYSLGNCLSHPCFRYIFLANHPETGVVSGTYQGSDINSSFDNQYDKKGVKTFR